MSTQKLKRNPKPVAPVYPPIDHLAILANRLDRMADAELFHGHHLAAERLANRAAELRGAA